MNKTFVRIMGGLLAIFFIIGLLVPAFASTGFQVGSDTKGVEILTGTPSSATGEFNKVGRYNFTVVKSANSDNLRLSVKRPGASAVDSEQYGVSTYNNKYMEVWGLTLKKPNAKEDDVWNVGDTFYISIVNPGEGTTSGIVDTASITTTSGSSIGTIYKNRDINAKFTIVEPTVAYANVLSDSVRILYESDSFVRRGEISAKKVSGGNEIASKATFEVNLNGLRYTGKGNSIRFKILYSTADGKDYITSVVYNVDGCKEDTSSNNNNSDDDDDDKVKIDPLTPYIIAENYTYGGTSVVAGTEFKLRLTLRNTSSTHTLENIKMSVSPKGVFSMTSSSNTFYIDSLMAGSTIEKEITLYAGLTSVTDTKDSNSIGIDFDFQYVANDVRKSGTSNENITIPVFFPDRFEYTEPSYPKEVYVGEEFSLYIPFVNKGRSTIYNLSAELVGAKATQDQKIYLGNINAGTENSIEFYVAPDQGGELDGKILITYEDANMNLIEKVVPFNLEVIEYQPPVFPEGDIFPELEGEGDLDIEAGSNKVSTKNVLLGISFVIIAGMSGYITVEKIKYKRSEFDDETI